MRIHVRAFAGANRKVAPRLLEPHVAQDATNARLDDGNLAPLAGTTTEQALARALPVLSIYRFADTFWFEWQSAVDVARGPVPGDTEESTYYTGDGVPKVTVSSIATAGGAPYPANDYDLGVPAPTNAPTLVVNGTADDPDETAEDRIYVYTYVATIGGRKVEGPPTGSSLTVTWRTGQTVDVTMDGAPAGNLNVTHKRIYRFNAANSSGDFQFVAEVGIATGTHTDNVAPADAGAVIESTEYDPPPADMHSLIALPNAVMAGASKNQLVFSEPGLPHAWPTAYRQTVDHPIVAVRQLAGTSLAVLTETVPYIAVGVDPRNVALERLESPYPCLSARASVDMGWSVIYPCPDGLIRLDANGRTTNITLALLTEKQWRALKPSSMHAYRWDDHYVCFYDTGAVQAGFVITQTGEELTFLDFYAAAGWVDAETGDLFLVVGSDIVKWDSGADLTYTWRSAEFYDRRPTCLSLGRVDAAAYPVTLKLYGDGVLKATKAVADNRPFVLPGGYRAQRWEFELTGTAKVREVELVESAQEMQGG